MNKSFKENADGGIDVYDESNVFAMHLNAQEMIELKNLVETIEHRSDVRFVLSDILLEEFGTLNSLLGNSSVENAILDKVVADTDVLNGVVEDYECRLDNDSSWWHKVKASINDHIDIAKYLGEVLVDKFSKELCLDKWRVCIIEKGDAYGANRSLIHTDDKPVVEFYDMSQDKERFPNGQFTSGRYYLDTLLSSDFGLSLSDRVQQNVGLCLCGHVPVWTVQPRELNIINVWLQSFLEQRERTMPDASKLVCRGDVDVPYELYAHDLGKDVDVTSEFEAGFAASSVLLSRLTALPEIEDVKIVPFGIYDGGVGLNYSFSSNANEGAVKALLRGALHDMKYDVYFEPEKASLDSTLVYAKARSVHNAVAAETVEKEPDFNS